MIRRPEGCLWFSWLLALVFTGSGWANDPRLDQANTAWKEYARSLSTAQAIYRRATFREVNGELKRVAESELEVKRKVGFDLFRMKQSPNPETVYAFSGKYAFEIARNDGNPGWYIVRIETNRPKQFSGRGLPVGRECDEIMLLPLSVADFRLADLIAEPGFRVQEVTELRHQGDECLRVVFTNRKPSGSKDDRYYPESGTIILDPNRFFVVREARVICRPENNAIVHLDASLDYATDSKGRPLLRHFELGTRYFSEQSRLIFVRKDVVDGEVSIGRSIDDDEFSLRHFGLPEPEGFELAQNHWQWGLIAVALLTGALAIGFWQWSRSLARRRQDGV